MDAKIGFKDLSVGREKLSDGKLDYSRAATLAETETEREKK